jgi:hypothetical protein
MFREITIDEPIEKIVDDWNFLDEKIVAKFTRFRPMGQNIYGVRRRDLSSDEIIDPVKGNISQMIELGPHGVIEVHHRPMSLHVTTAGTPHRVRHNFGFWHINDMDELYLTMPGPTADAQAYCLIFMQHPDPTGHAGESVAEYCEQCLTMLFERHYRTAELGFEGVFKFFDDSMREYNTDVKNRSCPECGHVNPYGYTWNPDRDTPEMAAARKQW